jgi:prepilin-type N-terminal cleavage/methylation domain-containing protein
MMRARQHRGFTLIELAMAMFVMAFLLGTLMYTLSAHNDQRLRNESLRNLDEAKELLLTFAIVNGRLPCPASPTSNGAESETVAGTRECTHYYTGFLPARAIGFQPQDGSGYAIDAWGNRIRYAVAKTRPANSQSPRVCRPVNPTTQPLAVHFTHKDNLKLQGIDCAPSDLVVCGSSSGIVIPAPPAPPSCGTAVPVTNQNVVAAVIWSQGKNFGSVYGIPPIAGQAGDDERMNNKTSTNSDHALFVFHTPTSAGVAGGEFDDLMVWITAGQLYGRLVASGVLP